MNILKRVGCFLTKHDYDMININPFTDINGYHSAIYECEYCKKRITKEFKDYGGPKPWLM